MLDPGVLQGILLRDAAPGELPDSAVRGPERSSTICGVDDQRHQLWTVWNPKGDVAAPSSLDRTTVGLGGEVPIRQQPHVQGLEFECLTAARVRPAQRLWNGHVDR